MTARGVASTLREANLLSRRVWIGQGPKGRKRSHEAVRAGWSQGSGRVIGSTLGDDDNTRKARWVLMALSRQERTCFFL